MLINSPLLTIISLVTFISGALWAIFAFLMACNKKPGTKLYDPRITLYFSGRKYLTGKGIYFSESLSSGASERDNTIKNNYRNLPTTHVSRFFYESLSGIDRAI